VGRGAIRAPGAVYGQLLVAYTGISVAAASTAGEEEAGILALTLAHPVERTSLVLAKSAAMAISVALVALATFAGFVAGVAVAGGGIALVNLAALALQLACFRLGRRRRCLARSPRQPDAASVSSHIR
jgi:beta-exotoxin I transport system permease protein